MALSSIWDGLNPNLIASFYEVNRDGTKATNSDILVQSPLVDGSLDLRLNWNSPFEGAGAEGLIPTLSAMVQSGQAQPIIDLLGKYDITNKEATKALTEQSKNAIGKTGITKLNSTQVFSGMPPIKFSTTLLFRAWGDAKKEVEEPVNQFIQWALPKRLAAQSTIVARAVDSFVSDINSKNFNANKSTSNLLNSLFPSDSPTLIAMKYKGKTYSPLVIESVNYPLTTPIDSNGNMTNVSVSVSLSTLTAMSATDWQNISK